MQYNATIGEWMTDNGGEYIDKDYVKLLKDEGIEIQWSVPSQLQMNGRVEHFNRTIDEKAESMCHQACLPDSWWEFSILRITYTTAPLCGALIGKLRKGILMNSSPISLTYASLDVELMSLFTKTSEPTS